MTSPLVLPITTITIWISAAIILLLISVPVFITRAFFVKKIARFQATIDALEKTKRDLQDKIGGRPDEKKDVSKTEKGWVQHAVSLLLAVGGLAGLITAVVPLLREIRDIQSTTEKLDKQKHSLDFFNRLLGFDEANWKEASDKTPASFRATPKPRAYPYDGKFPAVIEADDGTTIKFTLPRGGARFLIRPRPAPK